MTIQEAIKSGKPYRRMNQTIWFLLGGLTGMMYSVDEKNRHDINTGYGLTEADVLADDWEIKE